MKISGGHFKGRPIKSPKGNMTRPTTGIFRESLFNIIDNGLGHPMRRVLDLFAGTGALTIEAFSRGAESAVLVEENPTTLKTLRANLDSFGLSPHCEIISDGRLKQWGKKLLQISSGNCFDTIFSDAPYSRGLSEKVLKEFSKEEYRSLFADSALWIVESSSREELNDTYGFWRRIDKRNRGESCLSFYRIS